MEERVRALLSNLGMRKSDINSLFDEEADVDVKAIASHFKSNLADDSLEAKLEEQKEHIIALSNKKLAHRLNRAFDMGMSKSEAEGMDLDDMVGKVKGLLKDIEGDAEAVTKLNKQVQQLTEEANEWKSRYEEDTTKIKSEYEQKIHNATVENLFEKEFAKVDWGINQKWVPTFKNDIKRQIRENYQIQPDGSILASDGGKAYAPDGKKRFESLSDPIQHFLAANELIRKSNGNGATEHETEAAPEAKLSDNARAMLQRAQAQAEAAERRRANIPS